MDEIVGDLFLDRGHTIQFDSISTLLSPVPISIHWHERNIKINSVHIVSCRCRCCFSDAFHSVDKFPLVILVNNYIIIFHTAIQCITLQCANMFIYLIVTNWLNARRFSARNTHSVHCIWKTVVSVVPSCKTQPRDLTESEWVLCALFECTIDWNIFVRCLALYRGWHEYFFL